VNVFRNPAVIIVLILLVVLLFGSRRLPELARSVGQSLKIFKKEVKELKDDDAPREGTAAGTDAAPGATPGTATGSATGSATGTATIHGTGTRGGADASQPVAGPSDPERTQG
jgi:sec-independent protein translocase protein TatA